jgi:hypothetical protein
MDLHAKKVWLPGAASFLLFLGWYFMLGPVPFDKMLSLPYLVVMPFVGAVGAYLSRRMKGSVIERILSALFCVFTFVALFAFRVVYGLFFEGRTLYCAPFPSRIVLAPPIHCCRWGVARPWRMAVLPPAPHRTVA